jgi:hypothetical protein
MMPILSPFGEIKAVAEVAGQVVDADHAKEQT